MHWVRKVLYFCILLATVWTLFLFGNPEKDTIYNYLYGLAQGVVYMIGGLPALIYSLKLPPSSKRSSILFFSLGALSWAAASIFWAYFNVFTNVDVPQPSIADALYILYSVFTGIGCWHLLHAIHNNKSVGDFAKPFVIIFIIFFAGMIALGWPEVFTGDSVLKIIINLQYPVTDGFLFAIAYVMLLQEHTRHKAIIVLFVLSMFFQVLGDVNFLILESFDSYWNGSLPDVLYMASAIFSSLMFTYLVPPRDEVLVPTPSPAARSSS